MRSLVIRGSKNIFTLRGEEGETECRLKGKVLKDAEGWYNPLAPGDMVETEDGLITGLLTRKNTFARFNQKGMAPQLLAANVDQVLVVTTPASPPFRPRFIDRVLFEAEYARIPAFIICNKYDLVTDEDGFDPDVEERLEDFIRIGYPVLRLSAKTGEGVGELTSLLDGKASVMVGQSGVGKSSLIKRLIPDSAVRVGPLNAKYDRGNHTTTQSVLLDLPSDNCHLKTNNYIIDTPGIRRFAPERVAPGEALLYMREMEILAGRCSFGLSCRHETEPGCKILEAVDAGVIHEERYESYLRIRADMEGSEEYPDYD